MANISYSIKMDLGDLMALSSGINATLFPLVSKAVNDIAQATASRWIDRVQNAKLWSGEKEKYIKTIKIEHEEGSFKALVYSDYQYAQDIETGRPPRDLKKMLDTSMKVRRWKDGTRFLVIPMRHNVSEMPKHVYTAAKALSASSIVGQGQRRAGELTSAAFGHGMVPMSEKRQRRNPFANSLDTKKAVMVNKNKYNWGASLMAGSMGPNAKGKTDRFAGMYRFDTSTGAKKSSAYLTFRVMSEKSRGWIIPAQPGQNIAQGVAKEMQPVADAFLAEAVKRTL